MRNVFSISSHQSASLAQSDARPTCDQVRFHWVRQHSFMEIDHEIFSMAILFFPLIQEGQLSVSRGIRDTSTG